MDKRLEAVPIHFIRGEGTRSVYWEQGENISTAIWHCCHTFLATQPGNSSLKDAAWQKLDVGASRLLHARVDLSASHIRNHKLSQAIGSREEGLLSDSDQPSLVYYSCCVILRRLYIVIPPHGLRAQTEQSPCRTARAK